MIEKDYYCTILLERFQDALAENISSNDGPMLFFKGGTCLSKIHARFCRMSEDVATTSAGDIPIESTGDIVGRFGRSKLPKLKILVGRCNSID